MPLARIDLPTDEPGDYGCKVADVVYEATIATQRTQGWSRPGDFWAHAGHPAHRSDLSRHRTKR